MDSNGSISAKCHSKFMIVSKVSTRHLWQGQQINSPLSWRSSVVYVGLFIWHGAGIIHSNSSCCAVCISLKTWHFYRANLLCGVRCVVLLSEPVCPAVSLRHVPSCSGLSRHVGPADWRGAGRCEVRWWSVCVETSYWAQLAVILTVQPPVLVMTSYCWLGQDGDAPPSPLSHPLPPVHPGLLSSGVCLWWLQSGGLLHQI